MKILFYLEKADVRGGIEIFAARHAAKLRLAHHTVETTCSIPADFSPWDEIIVHKCTSAADLAKFPPEKTICYVHDHEPICPRTYAYTPFRCNCSRAGALWPCIMCAPLCRNWKAALKRVFEASRRKRVMARLEKIVVISNFMKERLAANGIPLEKIAVEPPEIDIPAIAPAELIQGIDILYAGQLIRGKGVHVLIKALARLPPDRTLDIIGSGNMEAKLRKLAAKLGVAGRIRWHGFVEKPHVWMASAKCVAVPSVWQEPYGLVAAEAVALGKKTVASQIGGIPEACQGKAVLVEPGNPGELARAISESATPPNQTIRQSKNRTMIKAFVFIDALGWEQVQKYGFLEDLLPNRRKIEMQFGYSCTAIPTILSGKRPDEHGHLAFYDWAPEKSPFKMMRFLAPLLRPKSFWRRGRIRNLLSRFVKRIYGFTGYFQLYAVPIEHLGMLDYCEKKDLFVKGGLAPVANLADVWSAAGYKYHISNWRLGEEENFKIAENLFRQAAVERAFVYSAAFDALQHDNVGNDSVLAPKVAAYANTIRKLHAALVAGGKPFELTVFSDHGMTALKGVVDAPAALAKTGLEWGRDYASAIDSTMARFWFLKDGAEEKIKAAFAGFPGRWLDKSEMQYHGIWREDAKFGNAIFLADAGVQFCPSDMGVKPLNGMHGFDPADKDSCACCLSTAPIPDSTTRVCDYFKLMTE